MGARGGVSLRERGQARAEKQPPRDQELRPRNGWAWIRPCVFYSLPQEPWGRHLAFLVPHLLVSPGC